jgi:hypothetical protein
MGARERNKNIPALLNQPLAITISVAKASTKKLENNLITETSSQITMLPEIL